MMSRIRGRDTAPELRLRKILHREGFRYRTHVGTLPGRPDLVLPKHRAVIFVHGCFWHRHHGCRFATIPASNTQFWAQKFEGTLARDSVVVGKLREAGWRVAIVWECGLEADADAIAKRIGTWLNSRRTNIELPITKKGK
jgi:DNA mismatch endonuclease (patch repair protein)